MLVSCRDTICAAGLFRITLHQTDRHPHRGTGALRTILMQPFHGGRGAWRAACDTGPGSQIGIVNSTYAVS